MIMKRKVWVAAMAVLLLAQQLCGCGEKVKEEKAASASESASGTALSNILPENWNKM